MLWIDAPSVCAQWALSKNEWIYEMPSRRARYALKILQKLSSFNAIRYAIETRLTCIFETGLLVVKCQCHIIQKEALQSTHTHHMRARKIWISVVCTQRVCNIWRGEESRGRKSHQKRRLNVLTWVRRWISKFPQSTVIWICLWNDPLKARVWSRCEIYDSTVSKLLYIIIRCKYATASWDMSEIP